MDINAAVIITDSDESPFALFAVDKVVYGVSSAHVLSIEILQKPTPLVNAPHYTPGILDFRGDMIPLIDLRRLFGKQKRGEELRAFMEQSRVEHERWMLEIETAAAEGREPFLGECQLDGWLTGFTSRGNSLNMHVQKMVSPHKSLHKDGGSVAALIRAGKRDEAVALCRKLRATHYKTIMNLISTTVDAYFDGVHDMLIVLNVDGVTKGVVADEIVSVEYIGKFVEMHMAQSAQSKYVKTIAKRDRDNSTVLMLDETLLIGL
ncbi:MAG: chemotaxis protein CheW [Oscillospiraceae bacterium]|nr:chemotaxis protein CheW [Oscillospiraceae bacterium]